MLFEERSLPTSYPADPLLSRAETLHQHRQQLIAVNVDQVLITLSVVSPPFKLPIVDRYIIAARKGNMAPIIVVNKIDLLDESPEEKELYEEFCKAYGPLGYPIIGVSVKTGAGIEELREIMRGKTSVFLANRELANPLSSTPSQALRSQLATSSQRPEKGPTRRQAPI